MRVLHGLAIFLTLILLIISGYIIFSKPESDSDVENHEWLISRLKIVAGVLSVKLFFLYLYLWKEYTKPKSLAKHILKSIGRRNPRLLEDCRKFMKTKPPKMYEQYSRLENRAKTETEKYQVVNVCKIAAKNLLNEK
jgi:hypothetical protein